LRSPHQVVERGRGLRRGHVCAGRGRDVDRAARSEGELDAAEARVELIRLQLQRVRAEVADAVDPHVEPVGCVSHGLDGADAHDASPARDGDAAEVGDEPVGVRRQRVQEVDVQQPQVGGVDLQEVDAVLARVTVERGTARALVGADDVDCAHVAASGTPKRSTRRSPVARRR